MLTVIALDAILAISAVLHHEIAHAFVGRVVGLNLVAFHADRTSGYCRFGEGHAVQFLPTILAGPYLNAAMAVTLFSWNLHAACLSHCLCLAATFADDGDIDHAADVMRALLFVRGK